MSLWPFVPGAVLLVAGTIVLAVGRGSTAAEVAALLLGGVGGIWLVSAAFFAIGRSEERDRERRPRG